jgi:hypothetical protein
MLYRQGDVLIERVEAMPDSGTTIEPEHGLVILAEGEATGHHHSIASSAVSSAVLLDDEAKEELVAKGIITDINVQVMSVRLGIDGSLTHQEHGPHHLIAGDHIAIRQREYSPEAIRNVAD